MNKSELQNIKSDYGLFNAVLFNNCLPKANEVNFILHKLTFAAGFSRHRDKPTKNGNIHDIAFCKYYKFTQRQIREILIHEMIHLWQDTHVAEWRYKRCSNDIAHDRVFMSKMATINILLDRKGFDLKISDTFKEKLLLDENVPADAEYCIFMGEDYAGEHVFFKVKSKYYDKIIEELKNSDDEKYEDLLQNMYVLRTKNYRFNCLEAVKTVPRFAKTAEDQDTKEDLYEMFKEQGEWIIKDGKFVK